MAAELKEVPKEQCGVNEFQPPAISEENQKKLRTAFDAVQAKEKEFGQAQLALRAVAAEVERDRAKFQLTIREVAEEHGVSVKEFDIAEEKDGSLYYKRKGG